MASLLGHVRQPEGLKTARGYLHTWLEGLVSEHDAGTYTVVYYCKGTCVC